MATPVNRTTPAERESFSNEKRAFKWVQANRKAAKRSTRNPNKR